jgi:hypothetical protein
VESSLDPYIIFEDQWGQQIVIDREKAENTHQEILETYRIPFDRSEDLRK